MAFDLNSINLTPPQHNKNISQLRKDRKKFYTFKKKKRLIIILSSFVSS
jgi:hypothetical protein